jgi:hypothetical protein
MSANDKDSGPGRRYGAGGAAALAAASLVGLMVLAWYLAYPSRIGPGQPIPFSHRVHAYGKSISCLVCHSEAPRYYRAGIPPLETCMLCHRHIAIEYEPIRNLREHYFQGRPVVWKRIYALPEFVYFPHSVHLGRGVDCGRCHGDVERMDRVTAVREFSMGFCIGCHRESNATHDCFTCHR